MNFTIITTAIAISENCFIKSRDFQDLSSKFSPLANSEADFYRSRVKTFFTFQIDFRSICSHIISKENAIIVSEIKIMLKLYGGLLTRAFVVEWYLIELGLDYEFIQLDMSHGEHLKPDFLAINPMGKLPAIVDDGFILWESGAILLYLAQKYGRLPEALPQKAEIFQWILFANATLINGLFVPENLKREHPRLLTPLSQKLENQPFLLGKNFSVVDVAVGAVLAYIPILLQLDLSSFPPEIKDSIQNLAIIDFDTYPGVREYIKRLSNRKAFEQSTRALRAISK